MIALSCEVKGDSDMSSTGLLKKAMKQKKVTQIKLAEMLGKPFPTVRNTLVFDNMKMNTLEEYADALGCDVVLLDRETGEIYR